MSNWQRAGQRLLPEVELVAEEEAVMETVVGTFGPLAGGGHLREGWLGRHEGELREMKCGCELHVQLSRGLQGCQPFQGSSSDHTALSIPWQPGVQRLVSYDLPCLYFLYGRI